MVEKKLCRQELWRVGASGIRIGVDQYGSKDNIAVIIYTDYDKFLWLFFPPVLEN